MAKFNISFKIPAEKLVLLADILNDEVEDLKIEQIKGTRKKIKRTRINRKFTRVEDLILANLKVGEKKHLSFFQKVMEDNDYNPSTASPTLSKLVKKGLVVMLGKGEYERISA